MIRPSGIAHAGLYAANLEALAGFYEHTLGLRVIERHPDCYIFDAGGNALLEIWGKGVASPSRKTTGEQSVRICFLVERIEPAVESLRSQGLVPAGEIGCYLGTRWIHYVDPEGNAFGLVDQHG